MPVSTSFKDADKKANDLFKKGFADGRKVTTNTNTATGVSFKTESTKSGSNYGTKLSIKGFKMNGMSLDKFEVTNGNVVAETSFSDNSLVPNAVFSAKTSLKQGGPTFGCAEKCELGVKYTVNPDIVGNLNFDLDKSASFNIMAARCCMVGGFEAKVKNIAAAKDVDYSFLAGYNAKNFNLVARFSKLNSCTLSAYHQYSGALALGTVASVDISKIRAKGTDNAVTDLKFGAKYNIDSVSDCAAQLSKDAVLKVGYSQKLYPSVKATVSASVDLKSTAGNVKDPMGSLGFQLDLGDL